MTINFDKLPQLPQDKANHYLYGTGWSVLGLGLGAYFGHPLVGAVALTLAAGFLKEVWDKVSGLGDPDPYDFLATAAGALPVAAALALPHLG